MWPGYQTEFSPAHTFFGWEVRSGITQLRRNYLRTDIAVPIKLSRRALYDDGQMINSNVTNHVTNTRVEFVFNKHGWRWRSEMYRFESVLEDIDSTFIVKKEQINAIKAFVDRKDVFAVLPTRSGISLMYQLTPWSTLWSYYVALIGSRYIQLSEEDFFSWFG